MPQHKPMPENIKPAEYIAFSELFKVIPMEKVKEVLCKADANDERVRDLPSKYMVYFVIALSLYSYCSATQVFCNLVECLKSMFGPLVDLKIPAKSSFTYSRQKLGIESFQLLFREVVSPIAKPGQTVGAFFKDWRLVAIDGTNFHIPDTPENAEKFGRAKTSSGPAAFPAIRCVGLIEIGTRVLFDYALGPSGGSKEKSENALAIELLPKLKKEHLCIADRLYGNYKLWKIAADTGAALLWRVKADVHLDCERVLGDGSYVARLYLGDRRKSTEWSEVRVIEYQIDNELYRLITNILSVSQATNEELANLYHERWEHENANKEQKRGLNAYLQTLRSKTPELVEQELIGLFLMYYAVRTTMHEAALSVGEDVDRLSFTWTLDVIRRQALHVGAFSP